MSAVIYREAEAPSGSDFELRAHAPQPRPGAPLLPA